MAGPLEGIVVLDLSAVISGPMAAQWLADQGADVIKIEPTLMGDITRIGGYRVDDISAMYVAANRGKRSIALDLTQEAGVEAVLDLAEHADVLIQNFRPGAVDRMGIGPEAIHARNPDLIYVSISGFGPSGPYHDWRVYDPVVQAISGVVSIQKSQDIPIPDLVRTIICDKSTALTVAGAVSSALYARATGKARGQHLEVPMIDSTLYFLWPDTFMGHTMYGEEVAPGALLYDIYRLQQTADGHIVYFSASDKEFAGLAEALGHPEWAQDERFATPESRFSPENFETLGAMLHNAFLQFTSAEIMERLHEHEVPGAPVLSLEEVFDDPQVRHNDAILEFDHPSAGPVKVAKPPVRWSHTSPEIRTSADHLGESTDEILAGAGYDADAIAALREAGVILGD
ncbi:MAG: CoA transferase [Actinomycetota bacterium]